MVTFKTTQQVVQILNQLTELLICLNVVQFYL